MTLLDISKIKDKEGSNSQASSSAPATPAPNPGSVSAPVQMQGSNQSESENFKKVLDLLSVANKIYETDVVQAEKKYDEIKEVYNSLSGEEKTKVYSDCMKLFNLLSKN